MCGRLRDVLLGFFFWWRLDARFLHNNEPNQPDDLISLNERAQAFLPLLLLFVRRGRHETGQHDGQWHWSTADSGNDMNRDMTLIYARNTQHVKIQHSMVLKTCSGVCPALSPLSGVSPKKNKTKKTLFQSSSLAWSSRGAVRNVLNGRSMRRLVGK